MPDAAGTRDAEDRRPAAEERAGTAVASYEVFGRSPSSVPDQATETGLLQGPPEVAPERVADGVSEDRADDRADHDRGQAYAMLRRDGAAEQNRGFAGQNEA